MALTWQVTQQDTLRIQDRATRSPVMWLCGGILLLAGGRFAWWLLLALGEMAQAVFRADFGYVFTYLLGLVILLVMTAAFLLPGLWMILFSMGVFASRRILSKSVSFVGAYYLLAGLLVLSLPARQQLSPWVMGGVFGVGQLFASLVLYWTLERS